MNLKELAHTLGLSPTTVSRALNGYPEVAEATRERVQSAARKHNYQPNARAQRLATGRAMAIGHVIPVSDRHEMVNPVFADFVSGAGEAYLRHGYDMVLSLVADRDQEDVYRDLASKGSVDGIIVHAPRLDDRRIALLHDLGLPFVVHGRASNVDQPYNWVDVNNRRAFERATAFLLDLGHRRIGLVNGLDLMDFAERRREGYIAALRARDVPSDPRLIAGEEMTEMHGYRSAMAMLALDQPATAFVTSSLIVAIGVRRAVEEHGLKLGRDVSLVTHDDDLSYLRNGAELPIFTAVRSSVRHAGRLCAEMLIEAIRDGARGERHTLLEADLMVGTSTGPAPTGPAPTKGHP
ncbi:LacI family DNA-binding transcriptional regulator [Anianabacter salinae]|uniref:LacI family DNA-binding transcriptional regulator n=1 Tax=Anianabacter salinae TaxID=2851023 RepID=UPI00225E0307|nr:substrate-binding domain-containing protein [Anianabacter salinae]MBV0912082.1 substrate-binding domain-containing protein [Anianabacter salinae]